MTQLNIERIALRLHGVSTDIAQAAIDGLDAEIVRRLQVRGIDVNALSGMVSGLRLPSIHATQSMDAESLRAKLADGLIDLLAPAAINSQIINAGGNS